MLTKRKADKLTILIEKYLLKPGQYSAPVTSNSWSTFNAGSQTLRLTVVATQFRDFPVVL